LIGVTIRRVAIAAAVAGIALITAAPAVAETIRPAAPAPTIATEHGGVVTIARWEMSKFKCASPRGQLLLVHWQSGSRYPTVAARNDCNQKRYVRVHYTYFGKKRSLCIGEVKAKHQITRHLTLHSGLTKVTSPSKCMPGQA
jgi:hypothetical protein